MKYYTKEEDDIIRKFMDLRNGTKLGAKALKESGYDRTPYSVRNRMDTLRNPSVLSVSKGKNCA